MRLLMKFGGTSVGDQECIGRVVGILNHYHTAGNELCVVVSAMSGVTDQLHAIAAEIEGVRDDPPIDTFITSMRTRHGKVVQAVAPGEYDTVMEVIDERLCNLKNILTAVHNLRELTPPDRVIISYRLGGNASPPSLSLRHCGKRVSPPHWH